MVERPAGGGEPRGDRPLFAPHEAKAGDRRETSTGGRALEEWYEDARSGDIAGYGGFVPAELARHYLQRASERQGRNASLEARIDALAERLVDRILIDSTSVPGGERVQVKLVGEVFDGAEIWIRRERGELRIDIAAGTERSREFLEARRGDLARALGERLGEPVRVGLGDAEASSGSPSVR